MSGLRASGFIIAIGIMNFTNSEIFKKAWLWSVICGAAVAVVFWLVMYIPVFHWIYKCAAFMDLLILFGVAGSYFGAGYVGWRIAVKHYGDRNRRFIKRYIYYSLLSFVILLAVSFSPLSFMGLLWSFVAPLCVLQALKRIRKN